MTSLQVREFHTIFGHPVAGEPTMHIDPTVIQLRYDLIAEEMEELGDAYAATDWVEVADALGDLVYVIHGAALVFGYDLDSLMDEARASDSVMAVITSELNPILTEAGRKRLLELLEVNLKSGEIERVGATLGNLMIAVEGAAIFHRIPLEKVVEAIHQSNLSKLGEDGKPLYLPNGKVAKGPNYKTPTEAITLLLKESDDARANK